MGKFYAGERDYFWASNGDNLTVELKRRAYHPHGAKRMAHM